MKTSADLDNLLELNLRIAVAVSIEIVRYCKFGRHAFFNFKLHFTGSLPVQSEIVSVDGRI